MKLHVAGLDHILEWMIFPLKESLRVSFRDVRSMETLQQCMDYSKYGDNLFGLL
eukprot:m.344242 g.344242  ORF g.344242 m.344242 type:complete len:54 (+) comp24043_c0_seq1:1569-1730(+)